MAQINYVAGRRRFLLNSLRGMSSIGLLWGLPDAFAKPSTWSARVVQAAAKQPLAVLNRLTWGVNPADWQVFHAQGVESYLNQQLDPQTSSNFPPEVQARLAALTINQQPQTQLVPDTAKALRQINQSNLSADEKAAQRKDQQQKMTLLAREAAEQQLLYTLYASDQLRDQLAWFWQNHFSVFAQKGLLRPMMGDYYARVIRPHALGRFEDLLRATVYSPQMLIYLDNAQNTIGHVNENYARELMELHTLGVNSGYTQVDVTNLARVLTGLGVDLDGHPIRVRPDLRSDLWQDGLVVFNPALHDPDPKVVLGHVFKGAGREDIDAVIHLLAQHSATARHVCTQLAQFFVAQFATPSLIHKMVLAWHHSDGSIPAVMRVLIDSPEFITSLGGVFKDPAHYVISAVRLADGTPPVRNLNPLINALNQLGEPFYGRQTPDGYPLDAASWNGSGQMTARFLVAQQIVFARPALYDEAKPAPPRTPASFALWPGDSAGFNALIASLSTQTQVALAQTDNPAQRQVIFFSSPEFMQR
jgi:uncharacterized protein (DUF1800 family)